MKRLALIIFAFLLLALPVHAGSPTMSVTFKRASKAKRDDDAETMPMFEE